MPVLGDFRLVKKLGQGAMATVYKAVQISQDRKVAIKLLHRSIAENPKLVERFSREARVLCDLNHPNIVRGYGVGEVEGIHYFVMEYVSGVTLQHVLNALGRITVGDALHVTVSCAAALGYAHERALIHRDVKPDNILITRKGIVKLADLGMVKMQDEDMALTQTGHAVGTPWYMPLEQARNAKDADGRCDIYALGCCLYCMLTGKPPFIGANIIEVIHSKERGTFPPARDFNPEVTERLELIIGKMTAKLAKHRYDSCAQLVADLESTGQIANSLSFLRPSRATEDTTPVPARRTPMPDQHEPPLPDGEWFLRQRNEAGESSVRQVTTDELLRLLEEGQIHPGNKISKHMHKGYRSLATYREFEQSALTALARSGKTTQSPKYQELYRQIEEEKLQREMESLEEEEVPKSSFWTPRNIGVITVAVLAGAMRFWLVALLGDSFRRWLGG
jgi:serine/threonine-protein kinase